MVELVTSSQSRQPMLLLISHNHHYKAMKAAVLHQLGQAPKYENFEEPVAHNEHHILMTVKAAALKNLDKGRASGHHYASYKHLPVVVGTDGVGVLENGTRVYAAGITGPM